MELIASIIGIAAISFLLIYILFALDPEHFLLKLLFFFVVLVCLPLIPKLLIDNAEHCELVINETQPNFEEHHAQGSVAFAGLTVSMTTPHLVKINTSLSFFADVYSTKGAMKTNATVTCEISANTVQGDRLYITAAQNVPGYNYLWNGTIPAAFLNETGEYHYQMICLDGTEGGYLDGELYVTSTGGASYNLVCIPQPEATYTTLLGVTVWIWRFSIMYMLLFLGWFALKLFGVVIPTKASKMGWKIRK